MFGCLGQTRDEIVLSISILLAVLFCFSQCHHGCIAFLNAIEAGWLCMPFVSSSDYFPSLPMGGGAGHRKAPCCPRILIIPSLSPQKFPQVRCAAPSFPSKIISLEVGCLEVWLPTCLRSGFRSGGGAICSHQIVGGKEGREESRRFAGHPAPLLGCETIVQQCHKRRRPSAATHPPPSSAASQAR